MEDYIPTYNNGNRDNIRTKKEVRDQDFEDLVVKVDSKTVVEIRGKTDKDKDSEVRKDNEVGRINVDSKENLSIC